MTFTNKMRLNDYRVHDDTGPPGVDDNWLNELNTPWNQLLGVFRLRMHLTRINPSTVLVDAFQLVYAWRLAGDAWSAWTKVKNTTTHVKITGSTQYVDDSDCLELLIDTGGGTPTLIGAPNGQYNCVPGPTPNNTGVSSWPAAKNRRVETEYALELVEGDVTDGNEIKFGMQIAGGEAFTYSPVNRPVLTVVIPTPSVTSADPNTGYTSGGTPVTVTGSDFNPGVTLTFGGFPATSIVRVSSTTITACIPAHTEGAVDVVAQNPGGAAGTLVNGFTYGEVPVGPGIFGANPTIRDLDDSPLMSLSLRSGELVSARIRQEKTVSISGIRCLS